MSEELETEPGATTRRRLLMGAGAVGATAVLAACGDSDDGGDAGSGSGSGPTIAPDAAESDSAGGGGAKIAAAADIPVGGGAIFASQGVVVTQPAKGTFKGFSATCTHQGCPLANVDGGTINCNCHNSKFSIEDGSPKSGPASKPLEEKTVTLDGEDILLG